MVVFACKKEETPLFNSTENVYFDFMPDDDEDKTDSILYSFAYFPDKGEDTVFIPVRISGFRMPVDRKFILTTVDSSTTAVASKHYKPLEKEYTMPADSGICMVPLILINKDTVLKSTTLTIGLTLKATTDLGVTFTLQNKGIVKFSNRLEKPVWWEPWAGELGTYSRVKHELFIRVGGTTELGTNFQDFNVIPKALYHIRRFRSFLLDPFKWVEVNAGEGYVVTMEADGFYYFYSITNPDNKYKLVKNPEDGRYYFTDEKGERVV
jgi:hypothetical protein